jgi:3-isopropylmalate/(R)-2-methylmalate dehydratase small subunit
MKKFTTITELVIPLFRKDVDTDMIIPAQHLTQTSRDGFGNFLFERLKSNEDDFPFNQDKYKSAKILVVGENFGCGSSREHAVWALMDAGIEAVIGISFADIFASNSSKNGLLLIQLDSSIVKSLASRASNENLLLEINLAKQQISDSTKSNESYSFYYDAFHKHCLLNGLDQLNFLLENADNINSYFNQDERSKYLARHLHNKSLTTNLTGQPR